MDTWPSEKGGYSVLRHLPMVVGLVPVARGGLVVRGGARVVNVRGPQNSSPCNSHRDERDHSRTPVLLLRACSWIFIHLSRETHTALALLCSQTPPAFLRRDPLLKYHQRGKRMPLYGAGLVKHAPLSVLIGQAPTAHLSGAESWPLPETPVIPPCGFAREE